MDSNFYKIPDIIIQFSNAKNKQNTKELENFINNKIKENNGPDTIKLLLESFKAELFDLNPNYRNYIIHGDISPIMAISEIIYKYDPDPKLYFILFKPIFDLYQSNLESKHIINFTNRITNFLLKKKKIVLSNFNDLFEVLILLKLNQEQDIKNSGNSLDKLLKESLQEYTNNMNLYLKYFDFDSFCEKINEKINLKQYVIISLLVNWIGTICQIRKTGVVKFFQNILPWIFKLQNGIAKDVSKNAIECLDIIKKNIKENFTRYYKYDKNAMEEILLIIIKESSPKNNTINIHAWKLLKLYLKKSEQHLDKYLSQKEKDKKDILKKNIPSKNLDSNNLKENDLINSITFKENKSNSTMCLPENLEKKSKNSNDKNISFNSINNSNNINTSSDNDKKYKQKLIKINTVKNPGGPSFEFKNLTNMQTFFNELSSDSQFTEDDDILEYIPFKLFSQILVLITETYSQQIENPDLIKQVNKLNDKVKRIIEKSPNEIKNYGFVPVEITNIILIGMKNPINNNKEHFLDWCEILYNKYEKDIFKDFNIFIKEFIQAIPPNKLNIFMEMVKFLSNIKLEGKNKNIIMKNLTQKLMKEPELVNNESYVIIILEHLTKKSPLSIVYESFADVLKEIKNFSFVSKMIHYLNQYLMRNPLAANFRKSLINNENDEKYNKLFVKMYNVWSINSISLLIFCVITEHFELAYNIILNLVKVQLDNDYYIHLGTLVQLLESELYDYIRIRLLEPSNNIYLIRTLYGILMLLPQGQAFNVLSNRMSNVQTLFEIENGFDNIKEENNKEEIDKFIEIFLNIQKMKKEDEENKNKNLINI